MAHHCQSETLLSFSLWRFCGGNITDIFIVNLRYMNCWAWSAHARKDGESDMSWWRLENTVSGLDNILSDNERLSCSSTSSKTRMSSFMLSMVFCYSSPSSFTSRLFSLSCCLTAWQQQDAGHFEHSTALLCKALHLCYLWVSILSFWV